MLPMAYIALGLTPSFIWLLFYLKKDTHPEPKKKILEIFFLGATAATAAAIIETLLIQKFSPSQGKRNWSIFLLFFLIAVIEEILKYAPVRIRALKDIELDEPIDVLEYMITSAMGFAALENIFLFFSEQLKFLEVFLFSGLRFLGATLLHALCSGILGYFIALSFYRKKRSRLFVSAGLGAAVVLHTLYNFSIMSVRSFSRGVFPALLLLFFFLLLLYFFKRVKTIRSVCKS